MHNEVPGIVIPADLRSRIANAASDEEALAIGIAEAQRLAIHAQSVARGLYLMPPFGSAQMALRVLEAVS
jgi:homocysteine S-methyltransferase